MERVLLEDETRDVGRHSQRAGDRVQRERVEPISGGDRERQARVAAVVEVDGAQPRDHVAARRLRRHEQRLVVPERLGEERTVVVDVDDLHVDARAPAERRQAAAGRHHVEVIERFLLAVERLARRHGPGLGVDVEERRGVGGVAVRHRVIADRALRHQPYIRNVLPVSIQPSPSQAAFKSTLKSLLFDTAVMKTLVTTCNVLRRHRVIGIPRPPDIYPYIAW